jgi:hypothetical protein
MSSLYEEVINANQQLTAALERIVKDLAEDSIGLESQLMDTARCCALINDTV